MAWGRFFEGVQNYMENKNEGNENKTSKFEWTLDNIRIEKIISAPIWATKLSWEVSAPLDVRHCPKLQSCAILKETYDATFLKWQKP